MRPQTPVTVRAHRFTMSDSRGFPEQGLPAVTTALGPGDTGAQIAIPSLDGTHRVRLLGVYGPCTRT
ncbi:protein of unknown function [Streptantibioticus cattleyicolor NRRL 8057 = DSM 46488]|nr:protein of unknown function [Streptantibioticus cattleyicolor NRRL 8057 = DSM 46488]